MSNQNVAVWIFPINGHEFDLEDLPIYFDGSPVTIVSRREGYFIQIPADIAGQTNEHVRRLTAEYATRTNGAGSLIIDGCRPFEVGCGRFRGIDETGKIISHVVLANSAEMRMKSGHVTLVLDGVAQPDSWKGAMVPLLGVASKHTGKTDALAIFGRPSPTWSELYVVIDLVKTNAGNRMYSEGWISRSDANLFTQTANSYTALGRAGRHGRDRGDPPEQPMSQHEALARMRRLVKGWLCDRSASGNQLC